MTTEESSVTAEDALEALASWGEFYQALSEKYKEYHGDLRLSLVDTLFNRPHDFLSKFRKQVAKEREVRRVGFELDEIEKITPLFMGYYQDEFNHKPGKDMHIPIDDDDKAQMTLEHPLY